MAQEDSSGDNISFHSARDTHTSEPSDAEPTRQDSDVKSRYGTSDNPTDRTEPFSASASYVTSQPPFDTSVDAKTGTQTRRVLFRDRSGNEPTVHDMVPSGRRKRMIGGFNSDDDASDECSEAPGEKSYTVRSRCDLSQYKDRTKGTQTSRVRENPRTLGEYARDVPGGFYPKSEDSSYQNTIHQFTNNKSGASHTGKSTNKSKSRSRWSTAGIMTATAFGTLATVATAYTASLAVSAAYSWVDSTMNNFLPGYAAGTACTLVALNAMGCLGLPKRKERSESCLSKVAKSLGKGIKWAQSVYEPEVDSEMD